MRTRVSEGFNLAEAAKLKLASEVSTTAELSSAATAWNAQAASTGANSKYVDRVQIDDTTGLIIITYNSASVGVGTRANTLTLTPWTRNGAAGGGQAFAAALIANDAGSIDWGYASQSNATATQQEVTTLALGTMQPNFAPAQCR